MQGQARLSATVFPILCFTICLLFSMAVFVGLASPPTVTAASEGSGWVEQTPIPGGDDLLSISAVDADNAWAVGGETILHTEDGGMLWTQQTSTMLDNLAVTAIDENRAWSFWLLNDTYIDGVQQTADGGDNWIRTWVTVYPNEIRAYLYDAEAVDSNNIWAVGGGGNAIIRTFNGGWAWDLQYYDLPGAALGNLVGISAPDAATAWVVGNTGTVLRTTDCGSTWNPASATPYGAGADIAAVDADTAWAISPRGVIIKTTDGGVTWEAQGLGVANTLNAICAVDANTAWAVGSYQGSGEEESIIIKTTDGGSTWVPQDSGVDLPLYDVYALDSTTAWAVGKDGVIIKTTDGGDASPDIVSVSPSSAHVGAEVTIRGCDFGDTQGTSYVSFGTTQATTYTSWSDMEIVAEVPAVATGEVAVAVITDEGTSNAISFEVKEGLSVISITPDQAMQNTFSLDITDLAGTGFLPGATVRLERGSTVSNAYNVTVVSDVQITCTVGFFLAEPGAYDVVVTNPDGEEARLEGGFTVTSPCGEGSGTALLMLGATLGLMSLAGSFGLRRRRRKIL